MCVCEVAAKGAKKVKVIKESREDSSGVFATLNDRTTNNNYSLNLTATDKDLEHWTDQNESQTKAT